MPEKDFYNVQRTRRFEDDSGTSSDDDLSEEEPSYRPVERQERHRESKNDPSGGESEGDSEEESEREERFSRSGGNTDIPMIFSGVLKNRDPSESSERVPGIKPDTSFYPVSGPKGNVPKGGLPYERIDVVARWNDDLSKRMAVLESHPMYIFGERVAGNLNHPSIESILSAPVQYPNADEYVREGSRSNSRVVKSSIPQAERMASDMFQNPLANGILRFKSFFTSALNSSYSQMLKWCERGKKQTNQKTMRMSYLYGKPHKKLKNGGMPTMEEIITEGGPLMEIFALLVSRTITWNSINSGNRYRLDAQYYQVMEERTQIMKEMSKLIKGE